MRAFQKVTPLRPVWLAFTVFSGAAFSPLHAADRIVAPPGVTTYDRGDGTGLADANGMTLYSVLEDPRYRTDPRFKLQARICAGACLESWAPFLAPTDATPVGDWTLVPSGDGGNQWSYKNFTLFTYKGDAQRHQTSGDGFLADIGVAGKHKVWRVIYEPLETPPGLGVKAAPHLLARVVSDAKGMTTYTFDKDNVGKGSNCNEQCARTWRPVLAPQLVVDVDKIWSTIRRDDGTTQWTHKGRPLYAYEGDSSPGDAKGDGKDGLWHATVLRRTPAPPAGITVNFSDIYSEWGPVYADQDRKTLYAFYHDDQKRLETVCNSECMKNNWRPARAPSAAKNAGPWSTIENRDGSFQWTYQGKILYTFAGDQKPGDMMGIHFGYPSDQSGAWGPVQAHPPS